MIKTRIRIEGQRSIQIQESSVMATKDQLLYKLFANKKFTRIVKKHLGTRDIAIEQKDGQVSISVVGKDKGNEIMTVKDLCYCLGIDTGDVHRLVSDRGRESATKAGRPPIPFFRIPGNEEGLRFRRKEILQWLAELQALDKKPPVRKNKPTFEKITVDDPDWQHE